MYTSHQDAFTHQSLARSDLSTIDQGQFGFGLSDHHYRYPDPSHGPITSAQQLQNAPTLPAVMPTQYATSTQHQPLPTQHVGAHNVPSRRVRCPHPGCSTSVSRPGDLARHMRIHQAGPRGFNCPAPRCRRKGLHGFERKDKMQDHYRNMHG